MTYVEWLRVRNALRVVAIVLGVVIVITLILRLSALRWDNLDSQIGQWMSDPGTKISRTTLPDGTRRTTIDDVKAKTTVVIDDRGYQGKHIVVTEPRGKHHEDETKATVFGSFEVHESHTRTTDTTIVDTNGTTPFLYYMAIADVVALIVATMLGAPFARENDGHLEVALTKPISRVRLAVGTMGVDIIGIVASSPMTVVALLICQSMFELPRFTLNGVNMQSVIMGVIFPVTWYAMLCAATSSLKRGFGVVLGLSWPVAILVTVFAVISWGNSFVGQAVHSIFWIVSRIDPLTYLVFPGGNDISVARPMPNFIPRASILLTLFVIYAAAAIVQWRRVEA
jgi:hypothetical protein